jgi:hypothetical protein
MSIYKEINSSMSAIGIPTEAVTQSLCDTRSALEGVLAAVNAMVRMQEEMLEKLGDIEEAIRSGTEKANEGIAEAVAHRAEMAVGRSELQVHTSELKKQRETNSGPQGS